MQNQFDHITGVDPVAAGRLITHAASWHTARRNGIGGSDAMKIMAGEWEALHKEKTTPPDGDPLKDVLAVQMGTWTEPLNRYWFNKIVDIEVDLVERLVHPTFDFLYCSPDGVIGDWALFEAKHTHNGNTMDDMVERYYPQIQHNLMVSQRETMFLSVFFGNSTWRYVRVEADADYQTTLLNRELEFWHKVQEGPVADTEAVEAPVARRVVDMTGNNAWASHAVVWLANKPIKKAFDDAQKELRSLVPEDAKEAHGHGVKVKRDSRGGLRFSETKGE